MSPSTPLGSQPRDPSAGRHIVTRCCLNWQPAVLCRAEWGSTPSHSDTLTRPPPSRQAGAVESSHGHGGPAGRRDNGPPTPGAGQDMTAECPIDLGVTWRSLVATRWCWCWCCPAVHHCTRSARLALTLGGDGGDWGPKGSVWRGEH